MQAMPRLQPNRAAGCKRSWIFLVICMAGLSALSRADAQQSPEQILRDAGQAYEKGDLQGALAILRPFLREHPRSSSANELMGLVLVGSGQFDAARAPLELAVELDPKSSVAHANLAADLAQLNLNDAAEKEFRRASELEPQNPELNHNLGELYAAQGKYKEAAQYLMKSQAVQPTYNNGFDLALAESKAGMLDAAESEIRLLLQDRQTADLHELLGNVLEDKHDYLAAGNELQRAALIDPSEGNTFAWAAELLRHRTLEPAVQVFAKGAAQYPRSWRMLAGLGVAQYLLGHNEEAVTAFCAAIDLAPQDPRPYFYLSRVHGIPESQQAAVAQRFEQYLTRAPKDAKAHYYYAMNLWGSDTEHADTARLGRVKGLLQQAIALDPKFADAHLQLGILNSGAGNDQAALTQFRRAVQLDPSLDIAHFRLGRMLIQMGQTERGQQELDRWKQLRASEQAEAERRQKELLQFLYNPAE